MFLEICMQIHSVVFASLQINKQKLCENNNPHCAGSKVFIKYQAQRGLTPNPLAFALGVNYQYCITCRFSSRGVFAEVTAIQTQAN